MPAIARRAALTVALCAATGVPLSGCSFLFVDAPPSQHARMRHFDCTTSIFMPLSDSGWAVAGSYLALDAVLGAGPYDRTEDIAAPAATGGVIAAAAIASAVYGYIETRECQVAKGDLARRTAHHDAVESTPGAHR